MMRRAAQLERRAVCRLALTLRLSSAPATRSAERSPASTPAARGLGNYTALQLFVDFRQAGKRWQEYEQASDRRKRITTSEGLVRTYGVAAARSDEEILAEDTGGEDVIALPARTWLVLAGWLAAALRIAAERDRRAGAVRWLNAHGLAWSWATLRPGGHGRTGTLALHSGAQALDLRKRSERPAPANRDIVTHAREEPTAPRTEPPDVHLRSRPHRRRRRRLWRRRDRHHDPSRRDRRD
jgi:hypothetical protein